MKIHLDELKRAISKIEKDKGSTIITVTTPMDRFVEIKYNTLDQEVTIMLYSEDTGKFAEIVKKERL